MSGQVSCYVEAYEPHLLAIRSARAALASAIPEDGGFIAHFSPVVPAHNRAGKLTGRALRVSVEPGSILSQRTQVLVVGQLASSESPRTTSISGSFWVGPESEGDLPLHSYKLKGPALAPLGLESLPHSGTFAWHTPEALAREIEAMKHRADDSLAALCEQFDALIESKTRKALKLASLYPVDADDVRQEMKSEAVRGIRLFASPERPGTSLYSWMDLHLWRACERLIARSAGLSTREWRARRWLIGQAGLGVHYHSPEAAVEATGGEVPLKVMRNAMRSLGARVALKDASIPGPVEVPEEPLREVFEKRAASVGLSGREFRVMLARHRDFTEGGLLPWAEVATTVGLSESACRRAYEAAQRKMNILPRSG